MINVQESGYFKSLPKMIQESIVQSGTSFNSEDELRAFAANLESSER